MQSFGSCKSAVSIAPEQRKINRSFLFLEKPTAGPPPIYCHDYANLFPNLTEMSYSPCRCSFSLRSSAAHRVSNLDRID